MDANPLYDLPEAGRRLLADPARLARLAASRAVPAQRAGASWVFPRAWVDAEAGIEPADAEALRRTWLERLAPPSFAARRTRRPRALLPASRLLDAAEAGRALLCDAARLARLDADGTLPALRVDGTPRFDADLVEALADEAEDRPEGASRAAARRAYVLAWAAYEYASAAPPPPAASAEPSARPSSAPPTPPKRSDVARAEGFATVDDDAAE